MKTSSNIQSNENRNQANGLQSVTISRYSRDNGNAYGRRTLRNVYYRVDVPHYCDSLYNHTEEARRKASEAVTAYYSEIVGLLEADGWTLQGSYGNGTAPTMTKDGQELYCHPQEISGNVNDSDTDHVAEVLAQGKTFSHRHTDLYEAIVCTADDDDELALYAQNYDGEIIARLQEIFTTPRRNLYKDTAAAQWALVRALKIRTDRHKFGLSGSEPVCHYVADKYDQAVAEGWIIEDKGKNGQQIARWLNKAETKAKEKADREKAQQEQERGAATLETTSEITDTQAAQDFADALEIREGDRVLSKHFQTMGTVTGIYEWNGGTCYDVTLDKAVRGLSGETITKTAFRRYGITKNYYPQGTSEIVGNAIYYAEELQAGFWGADSKPRTIFDCEIFKPTDRRPSWLLVADIFSQPQEMTLQQVADYLARRYQEANRLPEPPEEITISTDGEGHEPTLYERHDITAGEREAWTRHYADEIRNRAYTNRVTATTIGTARVEARIAYRNGTDDPDGMSYKVCWYDETQTGELHLVECENGISLEQAARHMADFSLLSECGLTLREILHPAA